jgi:hypothetical protein
LYLFLTQIHTHTHARAHTRTHTHTQGDKIIVFSDLVYSLKLYAEMLKRPLIYGETPERERQAILGTFRASDALRTICISKVGKFLSFLQISRLVVKEQLSYSANIYYYYYYFTAVYLLQVTPPLISPKPTSLFKFPVISEVGDKKHKDLVGF